MRNLLVALVGWVWWVLLPVRKRVAVHNFGLVFPEESPGLLRRTLGEIVLGYLHLALGRRAQVEGADRVVGGGLCLAGHGGAWDLALVSAGFHVPITIFVREPTNRLAAWALRRVRGRSDVELLPPRGSMSAAREALERGRLVVFVQDQRHNDGVEVPFFGRPALTSAGFAALAWRSRAPVFGAWQWWDEDGGHRLRFETLEPPFPETRDEAIVSLTRFSQAFYEDRIRERPHSWLWLHKRWKRGSEEQR